MFSRISQLSPNLLFACRSSSLFNSLINDINSNDPVVKLNAIQLCFSVRHSSIFLEKSILNKKN